MKPLIPVLNIVIDTVISLSKRDFDISSRGTNVVISSPVPRLLLRPLPKPGSVFLPQVRLCPAEENGRNVAAPSPAYPE